MTEDSKKAEQQMKTNTVSWVQDTRQEASKYGCNIKTRDEYHQENYIHIKYLHVRKKGQK